MPHAPTTTPALIPAFSPIVRSAFDGDVVGPGAVEVDADDEGVGGLSGFMIGEIVS